MQCAFKVLGNIWAIEFSFRGQGANFGRIINILYATEQLLGVLVQCDVLLSTIFWKIVCDLDTKSKSDKTTTPVVGNLSLIPEKKNHLNNSLTKISSRVITGVESTKSIACTHGAPEENPVCNPCALCGE